MRQMYYRRRGNINKTELKLVRMARPRLDTQIVEAYSYMLITSGTCNFTLTIWMLYSLPKGP